MAPWPARPDGALVIRFPHAWVLVALPLVALLVLRLRAMPRGSAWRRAVAGVALVTALAAPEIAWRDAREPVVLALDVSASARAGLAAALPALARAVPEPAGVVAFAATPRATGPGDAGLQAVLRPAPERGRDERDDTDLEAALVAAARRLGADGAGRIVLASDGWATSGDTWAAVAALTARGVAVDTLALDAPPAAVADAAVEQVTAPAQVLREVAFDVRASVRRIPVGRVGVALLEGDRLVERRVLTAGPDGAPVRFTVRAATSGERRYTVRVESAEGDRQPRNDAAGASVAVLGPPRVLWIGAPPPAPLDGLEVVARPAAGPHGDLARWDAVVLADVPADALEPGLAARLDDFVAREGGGVLMVGGPHAFGLGGWQGTAVGRLLPVDLDPGAHRAREPLALVVLLDKSGSMADALGDRRKIDAARDAALAAAGLLQGGDRLAVVTFDATATTLVPLAAPPARHELAARLAAVTPGGGTLLGPALAQAATLLASAGGRRHAVLVTDGRGEGGDLEGRARALREGGVTVSTVAVGTDADVPLLGTIARAGGGRLAEVRGAASLVAALRREVLLARGTGLVGEPTRVATRGHPVLARLAGAHVPSLGAYVRTVGRPAAAVVAWSERGEPLLALGTHGLGRTAAFTGDLGGAWSPGWHAWPGTTRLAADVVRWIARTPSAGGLVVRETEDDAGPRLAVTVEGRDGRRVHAESLAARVGDVALELLPRGPGEYDARLPARILGPTRVVIETRAAGERRVLGGAWMGLDYPAEYRVRPANVALLADLARATGGRRLDPRHPQVEPRAIAARVLPLAPWLAAVALSVFLADLALASGRLAGLGRRLAGWRLGARARRAGTSPRV